MLTAGYKQGSKNKNKNKLIFIIILLNSYAPVLPTKAAQTKADQLVLLKIHHSHNTPTSHWFNFQESIKFQIFK